MIYVYNKAEPKGLKLIRYPSRSFKYCYKEEWFDTEFAKTVFNEVENCEYLGDGIFRNKSTNRKFIADNLSTGTKTLLMINFLDCYYYMSGSLGDNCWHILGDIQDKKDIHLKLNWTPRNIRGNKLDVFYVDANRKVESSDDLIITTLDMSEGDGL